MKKSLSLLLTGIVDYAGLFPPAKHDMADAVQEYSDYLADPHRFMLGNFVVPVARLPEFSSALAARPAELGRAPWRLSVLAGPDVEADMHLAAQFNERHAHPSASAHAIIDSIEIKVSSSAEIAAAMSRMPAQFRAFFELPVDPDPDPLIAELRRSGGMAKIRTGGITQDAFPSAAHIARFLRQCHDHQIAFKATAGLHHPLRAEYRLTYEEHPPVGIMYGYLNVFIAAAFAHVGADAAQLEAVLTETDPTAFAIDDAGISYRDKTLTLAMLRDTRDTFAISFGSCSFREPVDDLVPLGWDSHAPFVIPIDR